VVGRELPNGFGVAKNLGRGNKSAEYQNNQISAIKKRWIFKGTGRVVRLTGGGTHAKFPNANCFSILEEMGIRQKSHGAVS